MPQRRASARLDASAQISSHHRGSISSGGSSAVGAMRSSSTRRRLKLPRISKTSPQDVRLELDALEQLEQLHAQRTSWSLRFANRAMETRFQLYHEDNSLRSSRVGCGCTLAALVVMQAGSFYDLLVTTRRDGILDAVDDVDTTHWALAYCGVGLTALIAVAWTGLICHSQHASSLLLGRFQTALLALSLAVVLVVLMQPAYSPSLPHDVHSQLINRIRRSHLLTKTVLLLLMALSAIATVWHVQFVVFAATASVAIVGLGAWLAFCAFYMERNWHIVLLFVCSLTMLSRALYRSERHQRLKFLRLRHLMLENIKLVQQNTFMQQQLSSHVDAIGIYHDDNQHHHHHRSSHRLSHNGSDRNHHHAHESSLTAVGRTGESWMENVLKVLFQLKLQLGDDVGRDLDFVMQTLTSEQDLFLEHHRGRRTPRATASPSQVDADTGWLALLDEQQRSRRRKSCDVGFAMHIPTIRTIRRTDSGLRQTVLKQVESYLLAGQRRSFGSSLPPSASVDSAARSPESSPSPASLLSTDEWTSKKLLARAVRSEEFNLLEFAAACVFPLTSLLLTTLESHNLFVELPIRIECAAEYGLEIESRYQAKNPYHNAVHAASVVWDINFFIRRLQQPVAPLQVFASLVAGAVHDVNHPGMNNAYLVATSSPLAIKYSDDSVLERMHLAEAFQAATKDGCDIFEGFSTDLKRQCRQLIIKMVLATDLSGHLKHVNRLKSKRYAVHSTSSSDLMVPTSPTSPGGSNSSSASVRLLPDDLVFHSIIMMADLGHAIKTFERHFAWSKLVAEEFFRQGDTERQFGMPISPLCDRRCGRFERSQIGFLEFVVLPLYTAARDVLALADFDSVLDRIEHNMIVWKHMAEQAELPPASQSPEASAAAAAVTDAARRADPPISATRSPSMPKMARARAIPEQNEQDVEIEIEIDTNDSVALDDASGSHERRGAGLPDVLHVVVAPSSTIASRATPHTAPAGAGSDGAST